MENRENNIQHKKDIYEELLDIQMRVYNLINKLQTSPDDTEIFSARNISDKACFPSRRQNLLDMMSAWKTNDDVNSLNLSGDCRENRACALDLIGPNTSKFNQVVFYESSRLPQNSFNFKAACLKILEENNATVLGTTQIMNTILMENPILLVKYQTEPKKNLLIKVSGALSQLYYSDKLIGKFKMAGIREHFYGVPELFEADRQTLKEKVGFKHKTLQVQI